MYWSNIPIESYSALHPKFVYYLLAEDRFEVTLSENLLSALRNSNNPEIAFATAVGLWEGWWSEQDISAVAFTRLYMDYFVGRNTSPKANLAYTLAYLWEKWRAPRSFFQFYIHSFKPPAVVDQGVREALQVWNKVPYQRAWTAEDLLTSNLLLIHLQQQPLRTFRFPFPNIEVVYIDYLGKIGANDIPVGSWGMFSTYCVDCEDAEAAKNLVCAL